MAVILNNKKSTYGNPYCYYTLEYTNTANRTATNVDITFKVTSHLAYQSSTFGIGRTLKAQIYINGSWSAEQTLKSSSDSWAGTGNHTKTFTLTINDLNSTDATLSNIKFKVNSNASDNACQLSSTACSDITIPIGHKPPTFSISSITETNGNLTSAGITNNTFVDKLSSKRFIINYTTYDNATISKVIILNGSNQFVSNIENISATQITCILFCGNINLYNTENKTKTYIGIKLVDSLGGEAATSQAKYDYVPYTTPNIIDSDIIIQRTEQTSGEATISLNGTFYRGSVGNVNQAGTYKPTIKYKFWEAGDDEPETYDYSITTISVGMYGTYSVSNYSIGSSNPTDTNYFKPTKAYRFKIKINDNFISYSTSEPKSLPVAQALWTEYKDRVDFENLTVRGNKIFYKNIMTANAKTAQTLSSTSWTKVPVQQTNKIGDKLEISNDGIKVLNDGYVYVSANILFNTGGTSSTRRGVSIYKNDTSITYCNIKGDTTYTGASITPLLIPVSANDIIYLYAINQGASGSVISTNDTYLNVEVIQW